MGDQARRHNNSTLRAIHARRELSCLHAARAGWRRWPDYPLEFPLADGGVEACACASLWMHGGVETGRADTTLRAALGRTDNGSWIPGRRGQYRPWIW